jgi:large subunit ribosomal protein L24
MKHDKNKTMGKRPRIRKGDEVIVIAGADKDLEKVRRVIEVYPDQNRVLVEGVAVAKRSYKKNTNPNLPEGGIHEKEMPIHISNVMLADPKTGEATRVGVRTETGSDGKTRRIRYAKASGVDIS